MKEKSIIYVDTAYFNIYTLEYEYEFYFCLVKRENPYFHEKSQPSRESIYFLTSRDKKLYSYFTLHC